MKICFVAQHIYPYLSDAIIAETAGGAELQQVYIGKGISRKGFDVSYISLDYGQIDEKIVEGVKIFKTFKPEEGIFGIRWAYPRLYKIWKALKKADADIYYVRCATFLPGIVAIFCSIYKKKFVYAGAHVTDFIPDKIRIPIWRDRALYKYGLSKANQIIVQSEEQRKLLWINFKLSAEVVRNLSPLGARSLNDNKLKYILWVSTIRPWKRPHHFLRLATSIPHEKFIMIGGKSFGDEHLYSDVKHESKKIKNLKFLGYQPFEVTEKYFDQTKLFINTSEFEGFPNTFLQAWRRGISVLSYVDPDDMIKNIGLGLVADSEEQLYNSTIKLLNKMPLSRDNIKQHFLENHSEQNLNKFTSILKKLVQ